MPPLSSHRENAPCGAPSTPGERQGSDRSCQRWVRGKPRFGAEGIACQVSPATRMVLDTPGKLESLNDLVMTKREFPHGLRCGECHRIIRKGRQYVSIPEGVAADGLPSGMLVCVPCGSAYAGSGSPVGNPVSRLFRVLLRRV